MSNGSSIFHGPIRKRLQGLVSPKGYGSSITAGNRSWRRCALLSLRREQRALIDDRKQACSAIGVDQVAQRAQVCSCYAILGQIKIQLKLCRRSNMLRRRERWEEVACCMTPGQRYMEYPDTYEYLSVSLSVHPPHTHPLPTSDW